MALRLTADEQAALPERAEAEGISMQEVACRPMREFVTEGDHCDRVSAAAELVIASHRDALDRLGR